MFLDANYVNGYRSKPVQWGFPSGPNSIGELTYRRTYRREATETWVDTCQRVVEGVYEILFNHCQLHKLPFDLKQARHDAADMFDRIWQFKFTPPGRGLWVMGTDFVRSRGSMALLNCAMVGTANIDKGDPTKPFRFLMDVSMLGVGCGFNTLGAGKVDWKPSYGNSYLYSIPDSREGWVESLGLLLRWGFGYGAEPVFDYSLIRPAGTRIKGFGGVCEGSEALRQLHDSLRRLIRQQAGKPLSSRDIVDLMNLIGVCVVAGNVRRTAEIAFGLPDDESFLDLKNYEVNPERAAYGWTSNNSIYAQVGQSYREVAERIRINGEPGLIWLDNMRAYGRMCDEPDWKDHRATGANPCVEQTLEDYEGCCLVETYLHRHDSLADYQRTLKYAFLYGKAVSLLSTHWEETNAVQLRNRRIGTSMSGVVQFANKYGLAVLKEWCEEGYQTVCHYDTVYSEWLAVRESIKKTSVKPSGTVSLLAGATPGCHYPTYRYYLRRIRYSKSHPDLTAIVEAGYRVEPSVTDPSTMVVEFPVCGDESLPTEREVSVWDKVELAALLQAYWADNQVSCTATFDPRDEGQELEALLKEYDSHLKGISFLPLTEQGAFPQMPYEAISREVYEERVAGLKPIRWPEVAATRDMQDAFCDGGACEIRSS